MPNSGLKTSVEARVWGQCNTLVEAYRQKPPVLHSRVRPFSKFLRLNPVLVDLLDILVLGSLSSTNTELSPKNFEKRALPIA